MRWESRFGIAMIAIVLYGGGVLKGQNPPAASAQPPGGGRGGRGFGRSAYPQRPPADPAALERGKGVYSVNCAFCHGSDARGGEGGPNLLRSTAVLDDVKGERIAPIVQNGRPGGMPALKLTPEQIADVAAYLHSFPVGGRDVARSGPPNIVVGNAGAGKALFAAKCAACHSETGDLKGLAARMPDAKALQQAWLMPGGGRGGRGAPAVKAPPVTVTVTLADGAKVEGKLERIDDFLVTLRDSEGRERSFPRSGGRPGVEIHDPLQAHLDLLSQYTDENIHDITAYLVTLK